ncbi:MAG TPA: hypothetical protein VHQ90_10245 [Thermoanaerobaculia bacterium]|nr:hypothetical protein [Thermoanaerobaculia bacterium]
MSDKAESIVHDLVDDLLPEKFDWERMVRTYPVPALLLAALGGYVLGRSHGPAILGAVSSFAAAEVANNVSSLLGQEID